MTDCPCCSGKSYEECCGPIIAGTVLAATPEVLMRSRYTAYARDEMTHLRQSMHPDTQEEFDEPAAHQWSIQSKWVGLEIVRADKPVGDKGVVEFIAKFEQDGKQAVHHELADFDKIKDRWYFTDGRVVGPATFIRPSPKVGRNDPCPCGSGKKYKKCCQS